MKFLRYSCVGLAIILGFITIVASNTISPPIGPSDSQEIHIAYVQNDASADPHLYYLKSDDNGVNFSSPIIIDCKTNTFVNSNPQTHSLKVDRDGNPHVVFIQDDGSWNRTYYTYSTNGGASFGTPFALDSGTYNTSQVALELDSNDNLHFAFLAGNIFYRKYIDGGTGFESEIQLDDDPALTSPGHLSMALGSSGNPHVTFTQYSAATSRRVYYVRSYDGGSSFPSTSPEIVDSGNAYFSWGATIRIDSSDNPHFVFLQNDDASVKRLYHNYSIDGGASFEGAAIIDGTPGVEIAAYLFKLDSSDNPHVAFRDNSVGGFFMLGNSYYIKSSDGGSTFDAVIPLLSDVQLHTTVTGQFTLDSSGNPYIAFADFDGVTDAEMFTYRSTDGGSSLLGPTEIDPDSIVDLVKLPYNMVTDLNDNPHLIYLTASFDGTNFSNYSLYHKSSGDAGLSYGSSISLDNGTGNSTNTVEVVYH